MFYLLQHIYLCLAVAALFGAALTWWFLRGQARPADGEDGEDLPERLSAAERDRDGWATKFAELQTEFASLSGRLPAYESTIQNWTQKAAAWDADRDRLVAELRACVEANGHLEVRAAELAAKLELAAHPAEQPPPRAMAAAAGVGAASVPQDGGGDIERLAGLGPVYGQKLRAAGVAWVQDLLEQAGSAEGRQRLAESTGIHRDHLHKWANAADLLRIEGITPDWAELLEEAGVPSVKELSRRAPDALQVRLAETNERGRVARAVPDAETVAAWITAAAMLEF